MNKVPRFEIKDDILIDHKNDARAHLKKENDETICEIYYFNGTEVVEKSPEIIKVEKRMNDWVKYKK